MSYKNLSYKSLRLPLVPDDIASLEPGDACLLAGTLYTLRDAGHLRLLQELEESEERLDASCSIELPYGLSGQTIFYAGPTPPAAGYPFGAIGPTTASRMDFAAPQLYGLGIAATIGKGRRALAVAEACRNNRALYFITTGGAAAYLARCVVSSEVIAYGDLGTEALRKIEVVDFPAFVGIDSRGRDLYEVEE